MSDEQEKFELEKDGILKSLPDNITAMFGTIGFCKDEEDDDSDDEGAKKPAAAPGEDMVACLVMDPYDVPPRPVRDVYWHNIYMIAKKKKKLKDLQYLVYHYGADDPDDCYSFISHEDFVSYESGLKAGYDKLPGFIQSRVDAGAALSEDEQKRVRGLVEMKEDALKDASERKRGNYPFLERHEKDDAPPAKRQKKK